MAGLFGLRSFLLPGVEPFRVNWEPVQDAECEKVYLCFCALTNLNQEFGSYLLRISKYCIEMKNNYLHVLKTAGLKEIL